MSFMVASILRVALLIQRSLLLRIPPDLSMLA